MRVDRGRLGWGLFLVVFGLVPLSVTTGLIDGSRVRDAWRLWPLVLVALGIGLLLGRRGAIVSTLVVAVTVGLAVGGAVAGSGSFSGAGCMNLSGSAGPASGILSPGTAVTIEAGCDHLDVASQPGSIWRATGAGGSAVAVQVGEQTLRIQPTSTSPFRGGQTMTVTLPADPQLAVDLKGSLGDLNATLPGAHLSAFHVDVSLGRAEIDLGGATLNGVLDATFGLGSGTVTLPAGAYAATLSSSFGSLHLCVPSGEAAHVTASASFGSAQAGEGFDQVADGWQTPDYATATQRADINVSASFGSITFSRGDCG